MMPVILELNKRKYELSYNADVSFLQKKIDLAEKEHRRPYEDFSDPEMLQYYLYRQTHLDKRNDRTERTVREYERELSLFIKQLLTYGAEIDVDLDYVVEGSLFKSLAPRHIRRYQEWLAGKSPYVLKKGSYSPATLSRKTTIIKSFLHFLYKTEYIEKPLHHALLTATVRKDDRPDRDLGPQEVVALLDYFKSIQHPIVFGIIHVLTVTGIRNEEFCTLKVSSLKYDSITQQYYLDVLGKGNKRRRIPIKEKTYNNIKQFRAARGLQDLSEAERESPLFSTNTGRPYTPSYLTQYLTQQIEKSGLSFLKHRNNKIGPHTFRHAFAIISRLSKIDIYEIQRSLGHERIETTTIYLEKVFEKEQHAIQSWNSDMLADYI